MQDLGIGGRGYQRGFVEKIKTNASCVWFQGNINIMGSEYKLIRV